MTIARKYLIDYSVTCYYHCMSRCVSQEFLLSDSKPGTKGFAKRQDWIEQRVLFLGNVFAIDILSFAIMDNHTHTVLHANLSLADSWSNLEVLKRWSELGGIPLICQLYMDIDYRCKLSEEQLNVVLEQISVYRKRLTCISTFMSKLNGYIARRANKDDGRKGHFWEGRFKSQALLSEDAVLACMAYVDLNPIRAGKAKSYKDSVNTSIKKRLLASHNTKQTFLSAIRSQHTRSNNICVCNISLYDYEAHLNSVLAYKKQKSRGFDTFIHSETIWIETAIDFEETFTIAAGADEDVTSFMRRARSSANKKSESSTLTY